ncbi:MAG: elongation factor G [Planctomycetota bacterium]|jgi:elongation factor G
MGQLAHLRNIGIIAHIDAGKTTVSERILFYSGVERRMGEVHEGSATMDWMDEERRRGITIQSAATVVPWREYQINLIDTPGHVDFTVEVERSMRVLDGAVLVINGVAGVQAQTETVWRQLKNHGVRGLAFVNQLDRPGADFMACLDSLRERLAAHVVPIMYPVGEGRALRQVIDLVTREALVFDERKLGRAPQRVAVPADLADEVDVLRAELLDVLAEDDEELLGDVLEGREPSAASIRRVLRARTCAGTLIPVLCGSALRNVGIQPLLDAVVDYLPAPDEVPPVVGLDPASGDEITCSPDPDASPCALAFKLQADRVEDLLYARIYSGTMRPGQVLLNPRTGCLETVGRVLRLHADMRSPVEQAGPGEIVALTDCQATVTGDTLCGPDRPLVLEGLRIPQPVLTLTVEPDSMEDQEGLRAALGRLTFEDPSFQVREDPDTGQWLLQGMGELHLEIKEQRLRDEFGLAVRVGQPRVAFRETPTRNAPGSGVVDRAMGEGRLRGAINLEVLHRPGDKKDVLGLPSKDSATLPGVGEPAVVQWAEGCSVPAHLRAPVAEALVLALREGPRFGYPLVGLDLLVTGGNSGPEESEELGLVQAALVALREALQAAGVQMLEPEMTYEVAAPADFMGGILGELSSRGAHVADVQAEGQLRRVWGRIALARMFGYASSLRSLSQGRASFSLAPAGFRLLPEGEYGDRGLL